MTITYCELYHDALRQPRIAIRYADGTEEDRAPTPSELHLLKRTRPEALRRDDEDGAHLYCTTCGSCGEDGCCPPEKCQKARRSETIEECAKVAEGRIPGWTASAEANDEALKIAEAIRSLKTIPSPLGTKT